jgi:hypothetical protein
MAGLEGSMQGVWREAVYVNRQTGNNTTRSLRSSICEAWQAKEIGAEAVVYVT